MFPENFRDKKYSIIIIIFIYTFLSVIFNSHGMNFFNNLIVSGECQNVGYPTHLFTIDFSLWNPYIQCGTYNLKDIGFQPLYPVSIFITMLLPNIFGFNVILILHYVLAGLFTYMFCGRLKLNQTASFIGGLCFMFCGFLMAHKGHQSMVHAAVWLPLVLLFIERFFENKRFVELLFGGAAFSMSILADYIAIPMYIGMVAFPYIIMKEYTINKQLKHYKKIKNIIIYSLIIFGSGLLLSSISIIPIIESLKHVTRESIDYKFFSSFSFRWKFLPTILFPFFNGTHYPGFYPVEYFGRWNLYEISGYMGIIPLVSAFICFSYYRKKNVYIYFWALIAVSAFILVLGNSTPIYKLMFHVPIYNMFRVPARNWFEVNFAVSMLFAYFVHYIISEKNISDELFKKIKRGSIFLTIFFIIVIIIIFSVKILSVKMNLDGPSSWMLSHNSNPEDALKKINLFVENTKLFPPSPVIYIPFFLTVISIILLLSLKKYYKFKLYWLLFSIFLFIDFMSFGYFAYPDNVDSSILKNKNKNEVYNYFRQNESNLKSFRIYPLEWKDNLFYPQINMLYDLSTVNAYSAIWLKNYTDITGFKTDGVSENYQTLLKDSRIISTLSVKYILTSDEQNKKLLSSMNFKKYQHVNGCNTSDTVYIKKFISNKGEVVFENLNFLPRARFVQQIIKVENTKDVKQKFKENGFNPCRVALVEKIESTNNLSEGKVIMADYNNNDRVSLEVKTEGKAFLVLADTYYPGWRGFIDDVETEIYRVNGVVRGILIPDKGNHKITFLFKPKSFYIGIILSMSSLFLLVIYLIYSSVGKLVLKR